jgi:hypothetical protein
MHMPASVDWAMKTSRPPGRSSRAAWDPPYGSHQTDAQYALITRSAHPSLRGIRTASRCANGAGPLQADAFITLDADLGRAITGLVTIAPIHALS